MAENNNVQGYFGPVLGKKAARITVLIVALVFAGGFWLLTEAGVIEPGPVVAIIGVVLFVIIAFPLGMLVGGWSDKKINPDE
ncbi:hypothetical protein GCM10009720_00930 [Yaniella flava]|uniref:Uncharacterized protein n=1 Tax=Yaniella flava TaxID=287930 RepID=A0ABP5FHH4_9MICC